MPAPLKRIEQEQVLILPGQSYGDAIPLIRTALATLIDPVTHKSYYNMDKTANVKDVSVYDKDLATAVGQYKIHNPIFNFENQDPNIGPSLLHTLNEDISRYNTSLAAASLKDSASLAVVPPVQTTPEPPALPFEPLKPGAHGPRVAEMKQLFADLNAKGAHYNLGRTGPHHDGVNDKFDKGFQRVVQQFQDENHIPKSGVMDERTTHALHAKHLQLHMPHHLPSAAPSIAGDPVQVRMQATDVDIYRRENVPKKSPGQDADSCDQKQLHTLGDKIKEAMVNPELTKVELQQGECHVRGVRHEPSSPPAITATFNAPASSPAAKNVGIYTLPGLLQRLHLRKEACTPEQTEQLGQQIQQIMKDPTISEAVVEAQKCKVGGDRQATPQGKSPADPKIR